MTVEDQKLPSGITVGEALRRASKWWDETGRFLVSPTFNERKEQDRAKGPGGLAPAILIPGSAEQDLKSPILRGLPWDQLDKNSKLRVVKVWHYWYMEQDAPAEARNQYLEDSRQRLNPEERPEVEEAKPFDGKMRH